MKTLKRWTKPRDTYAGHRDGKCGCRYLWPIAPGSRARRSCQISGTPEHTRFLVLQSEYRKKMGQEIHFDLYHHDLIPHLVDAIRDYFQDVEHMRRATLDQVQTALAVKYPVYAKRPVTKTRTAGFTYDRLVKNILAALRKE